ncbi:MAG: MBL fold metallo-hydrolase [Pseudomonadota bacterium]
MADVITIDCGYLERDEFAATYLITDGDRAAFIDNNTAFAVPRMLEALAGTGLMPEQVEFIIITHVHLDHAGGTSALASACPNATILAHPRAARHIIDPSRLVASSMAVYGEDRFRAMYGDIQPVPEQRVRVMADDETVALGRRPLRFIHTRGHANHHFCIVDGPNVFTGDAFGLRYPFLQRDGTFVIPSTSPTDFDGPLARESILRIVDERPQTVYPTHFGAVTDIDVAAGQLIRHLEFSEAVMLEAEASDLPDDALQRYLQGRLSDYYRGLLDARGHLSADPAAWDWLANDIDLNAQGLAWVANKRRRKVRQAAAKH